VSSYLSLNTQVSDGEQCLFRSYIHQLLTETISMRRSGDQGGSGLILPDVIAALSLHAHNSTVPLVAAASKLQRRSCATDLLEVALVLDIDGQLGAALTHAVPPKRHGSHNVLFVPKKNHESLVQRQVWAAARLLRLEQGGVGGGGNEDREGIAACLQCAGRRITACEPGSRPPCSSRLLFHSVHGPTERQSTLLPCNVP
jgi:hypothetical protein